MKKHVKIHWDSCEDNISKKKSLNNSEWEISVDEFVTVKNIKIPTKSILGVNYVESIIPYSSLYPFYRKQINHVASVTCKHLVNHPTNYGLLHILTQTTPPTLRQIMFEFIHETSASNASFESAKNEFKSPSSSTDFDFDIVAKIKLFLDSKRILNKDKPILLILNPFGGTGKGMKLYQTLISPLFQLADRKHELIETKYSGHAIQIANTMDLKKYSAAVTISGDGLFHELVNGLLTRSDWKDAKQLPISIIGSGTGNAMSKNLNIILPEIAVLTILNGELQPMDVFSYFHQNKLSFSHLSVTWTFIADLDIESESYRWMGSERFTLAAIIRITHLRTYKGKVYILPVSKENSQNDEIENIHKVHPTSEEYETWPISIDSEFNYFVATNYPYLSTDFLVSPNVSLNSGDMDIIWSEKMNRSEVLKVVMDPTSGDYVNAPFIKTVKAKAFVLEPGEFWVNKGSNIKKEGILNVSGERIAYDKISVRIHSGLMNSFVMIYP